VAERRDGRFAAVAERAEITRLGRGVDRTGALSPEGMEATLRCLESYASQARALGALQIAATATSAARDASNGAIFLEQARTRAGVTVEFIYGSGEVQYRRSFDVGSVRLTERFVTAHPIPAPERDAVRAHLQATFSALPPPPENARLIGIAGTVTTLYALQHRVDPYEAALVHGRDLTRAELAALSTALCAASLEERRRMPGLQPGRADVICAGALVLEAAMDRLHIRTCTVSDRGVRWGLLARRFGGA